MNGEGYERLLVGVVGVGKSKLLGALQQTLDMVRDPSLLICYHEFEIAPKLPVDLMKMAITAWCEKHPTMTSIVSTPASSFEL